MTASWSDSYNLSTSAVSVFPCEENSHVTVDYTQPVCAGDDDKASFSGTVPLNETLTAAVQGAGYAIGFALSVSISDVV